MVKHSSKHVVVAVLSAGVFLAAAGSYSQGSVLTGDVTGAPAVEDMSSFCKALPWVPFCNGEKATEGRASSAPAATIAPAMPLPSVEPPRPAAPTMKEIERAKNPCDDETTDEKSSSSETSSVSSVPTERGDASGLTDADKCAGYVLGVAGSEFDQSAGQQAESQIVLGPDGNTYVCSANGTKAELLKGTAKASACANRLSGEKVGGIQYNTSTHFYDLGLTIGTSSNRYACSDQLVSLTKQMPVSWSVPDWSSLIDVVNAQKTNVGTLVPGTDVFEVRTLLSKDRGAWQAGVPVKASFTFPADSEKYYATANEFASIQPYTLGIERFSTAMTGGAMPGPWYSPYGNEGNQYHLPLKNWQTDYARLQQILTENGYDNYDLNGTKNTTSSVIVTTAARLQYLFPSLPASSLKSLEASAPVILVLDYGVGNNSGNFQNFALVGGRTGQFLEKGTWNNGASAL
jgi:hypothetical protein